MKKTLLVAATLLLASSLAQAQSTTGTTVVSVTIGPEASITIGTPTTILTSAGGVFHSFTGTTSLTYNIRTNSIGGNGSITVLFGSDLTASASIITIPNLTYSCTVQAPGLPCTASQVASKTTGTTVAIFGADAHGSARTGTVDWSLLNDPSYNTDTFSATATFTIAAL